MSPVENPQHEYSLLIREHHLDTLGHVNHATYLQIFEEARWEWIGSYGLGLDYVQRNQIGPVILEANVKYHREVHLREMIRILSWCSRLKGRIYRIKQELFNSEGEVACVIDLNFGLMDLRLRKLIELPSEWEILFNSK